MDELLKDNSGMIRTGEGTSVNPDYLSEQGRQQALNYARLQKGEPSVLSTATARDNFDTKIQPKIDQANRSVTSIAQNQSNSQGSQKENQRPEIPTELLDDESPEDKLNREYLDRLDKQIENTKNVFNSTVFSLNTNAQGQINSLNRQLNERKSLMQDNLQRGLRGLETSLQRSGIARYSPISSDNLLTVREQEGIDEISKLDTEYNSKVAEINQALEANTMSVAAQLTKELGTIEEKALKAMQEQAKSVREANKELRDYNFKVAQEQAKVQEAIDVILKEASANKADQNTLDRIAGSGSVSEAIMNAGDFVGDSIEREYKLAQIQNLRAETAKKLQDVSLDSPERKQAEAMSETLDILSLTDSILNSPQLGQVFGVKNPFTYWTPGSNEQYVKNQVNQLRGFLAFENRQKLKGTGSISDFESKTLERAASSLAKNLSDKDAERELRKLRGAMSTASGLSATVKITDPETGEFKIKEATRQGIEQAIIDGLNVEYQ